MSFCLFLSTVLPIPVGGGAIERPRGPLLLAGAKPPQLPKNRLLDHSVSLKEAVELLYKIFINLLNFGILQKSAFNLYTGCEAVSVVAWHTSAVKWHIQKGECCYMTWRVIGHQ